MLIQIDTIFYDSISARNDVHARKYTEKENYFHKGQPIYINPEMVRTIRPHEVKELFYVSFSENSEPIVVKKEEVTKILEACRQKQDTAEAVKQISYLTSAIRDLWQLLRARLH